MRNIPLLFSGVNRQQWGSWRSVNRLVNGRPSWTGTRVHTLPTRGKLSSFAADFWRNGSASGGLAVTGKTSRLPYRPRSHIAARAREDRFGTQTGLQPLERPRIARCGFSFSCLEYALRVGLVPAESPAISNSTTGSRSRSFSDTRRIARCRPRKKPRARPGALIFARSRDQYFAMTGPPNL